jgi:hypothetical protein
MTTHPIEVNQTGPHPAPLHVSLTIHQDDAEALSSALSDLLCWCAGYRAGQPDSEHHPMGTGAARTLNIALKRALDKKEPRT